MTFYNHLFGARLLEDWNGEEAQDNSMHYRIGTVLPNELMEPLCYRFEQIDFIDRAGRIWLRLAHWISHGQPIPETRPLVAMDFMKPATVREGVKWLPD
ncbi:MAG: hypothetical protein ACLR4Z_06815 [Butyricicoccaceae bacterium]